MLLAVAVIAVPLVTGGASGAARTSSGPSGGSARSVDYRWYDLFDIPIVHDVWAQRERVGYVRLRRSTYPVTSTMKSVDGPRVYPNTPDTNYVYAPARFQMRGRNMPELAIDDLGGASAPVPAEQRIGFLPHDLMGHLGVPPVGGTATLSATMQYIDRARANQLEIPEQFGYHGWENETQGTITLDRAAARKALGISDADFADIDAWWSNHQRQVSQAWWWWLYDEGGDVHVGGRGRLDVRDAMDVPLQIWLNHFELTHASGDDITLSWDWVDMAGDMLWSRWISEAMGKEKCAFCVYEGESLSDLHFDATFGPTTGNIDADVAIDYALTRQSGPRTDRWVFEPASGDWPNASQEYRHESSYRSPGAAYADVSYGGNPHAPGYDYVPAAWNLSSGETLTLDWSNVDSAGGITVHPAYLEPAPSAFPGKISTSPTSVSYAGPLNLDRWSRQRNRTAWQRLGGLLPWGEPYASFAVDPVAGAGTASALAPAKQPAPVSGTDPYAKIPPFPHPRLHDPPDPPAPDGRSLRFDFYRPFDVPMVADRWHEYQGNDYVRINRLTDPVSYQTTPYFNSDQISSVAPFSLDTSSLRLCVRGHDLNEINIDSIGGVRSPAPSGQQAGFLPYDLLGHLSPGVRGGHVHILAHMRYGTRKREDIYRLNDWWGYYGWENFVDSRIRLDRASAQKVLGIPASAFKHFRSFFTHHQDRLETAWRLWFYDEYKRLHPMPFFNYPIQIWNDDLSLLSVDQHQVVLKQTVLNEALDVVYGRWFGESFMPDWEPGGTEDMYLRMAIGPGASDVHLDEVNDWSLQGDDSTTAKVEPWTWTAFTGDNPFLAYQYRVTSSPAYPYFALDQGYTYTPTNWDLRSGEQFNFHFGGAGLRSAHLSPSPADLPGSVLVRPRVYSITGPVDLTRWSKAAFPKRWAATGGLPPFGEPTLSFRGGA